MGAVALDAAGNLAAATSTGGTLNKAPGRVGDSSVIGCGGYADNRSAAASLTGWGEPIMKLVLGKWAVDRVPQFGPEQPPRRPSPTSTRAFRATGASSCWLPTAASALRTILRAWLGPSCDRKGIRAGASLNDYV